jgi:hypothetical protein
MNTDKIDTSAIYVLFESIETRIKDIVQAFLCYLTGEYTCEVRTSDCAKIEKALHKAFN